MPDERTYEPLRIRAHLQTGIISDAFLPLDGVLYYHLVRERLGPQDFALPGESRHGDAIGGIGRSMPFRRHDKRRQHWTYACSFAQWPEHTVEAKDHWSKRFDVQHSDLVDFGKRRGKVSQASGRYKAYRMPVFYRHALHVDWYAVADRPELERLLRFCGNLGKKSAQGWGAVLRWEVTPWPEDWSQRDGAGRLTHAAYDPGSPIVYGIRPSYWHPRHQFPCQLPPARTLEQGSEG